MTPVKYKSTLKVNELEKVKLEQSFDDGSKVKAEVPLFTGQQGLEGLIYIVDRFKEACKRLQWTEGIEMFEEFPKVLQGQAYTYWMNEILTTFPDEDDQTPETFQEAIDMLKISFGGGTLARNHILQYIQTNECKKPRKSTVEEHVRRITTLVSLANQSAGTDAVVTNVKLNELLLSTMPNQWQQNFKLSGHTIADMTTDKFITYFSEVKDVYDSEQLTNRRSIFGGRCGLGQERGGRQPFIRGRGRFSYNRNGRGRFSTWRRGGFYRRNFNNNFYRGGNSFNHQNRGGQRNQYNRGSSRGSNGGGMRRNENMNDGGYNNNQRNHGQTYYWNESNWNERHDQNNNQRNDNNTNIQENRIVEVNHWETMNNNREGWDQTRYYNPS
jgi:hypothetical protein